MSQVYCRLRPLDDPNEAGCVNAIGDTVVQLLPPEVFFSYKFVSEVSDL